MNIIADLAGKSILYFTCFLGKRRGFSLFYQGFGRNRGKGRGFLWWEEIGEKANNV